MDDRSQDPVVVCSILERDAATAARRIARAPAGCGLVEIRGDHLCPADLPGLVRGAGRPVVVTIRRAGDGGGFAGSEEERALALDSAAEAGAAWIDVEADCHFASRLLAGPHGARVVLSHHGGACSAGALEAAWRRLAASPAHRLKLVPQAESIGELLAVRALLGAANRGGARRLACFASGRAGIASRLLAPAWGSWATYGSAGWGQATASGQLPAAELLDTHDVLGIDAATELYALVGTHVLGSPSPAMHDAAYRAAGRNARYLALELDALAPELEALASLGVAALGVTRPFKEEAAARAVWRDPHAARSGAANTLVRREEGWAAHDTDGPAARELIRAALDPAGTRVAILGAGGTARAIAAALRPEAGTIVLYGRDAERAARTARALGVRAEARAALDLAAWDILIQATPLGSAGEQALAPASLRGRLVLDAVYASRPTPLCVAARARGLAVIDGLTLLAAQGARQHRIMTGTGADAEQMQRQAQIWLAGRAAALDAPERGA